MRTIVVPVDFSASSNNAAHYAADLALAMGADLHLIHIFEIPTSVSMVPLPETAYDEMRDNQTELLDDLAQNLKERTAGRVAISTAIEINSVVTGIKEFCDAQKPFLVLMGATGDSVPNLLFGSNTIRALHHLHYPILVIPQYATFKPVQKIVIACDREDIDSGIPDTLPLLKELSEWLGASLDVLHVLTDNEESASEAILEYNDWKKDVRTLSSTLHFIRRQKVDDGINVWLADHNADWLIVLPKVHSLLEFHRSRTKQIIKHCSIPIMSVHEQ